MRLLPPRSTGSRIRLRASHRHLGSAPLRISHARGGTGGGPAPTGGWAPQAKDLELDRQEERERAKKKR